MLIDNNDANYYNENYKAHNKIADYDNNDGNGYNYNIDVTYNNGYNTYIYRIVIIIMILRIIMIIIIIMM